MRFGALVFLLVAACGNDVECIEVETNCERLYEPTFDNVFTQTLEAKCGIAGPCHNAQAARGGVVYVDADEAYELLVDDGRVVPGDPGCSLLVQRVESTRGTFVMPPGNMLSEQERCSIRQWVENGAQR